MRSIGSFESAVVEADENAEPLGFVYNGEEYLLSDNVPMLPSMHLAKLGADGEDTNNMEALGAIWSILRGCMKDDNEYQRFEKAAVRESSEVIFKIYEAVTEAIANRPTSPSKD